MVALSRKFHSRPVFISVCSEIFVVTGRKTIRLDEAAEKRKTASAYLFDIFYSKYHMISGTNTNYLTSSPKTVPDTPFPPIL